MSKPKWQYFGNVNRSEYGGTDSRCIGNRRFQFVELINMDEACGRDNRGQPRYVVEVSLVALGELNADNLRRALACCGQERVENPPDDLLAECCKSYGLQAPLGNFRGDNYRKLLRKACRLADSLLDEDALEEKLGETVNRIGSTAREFMRGDIASALQCGCESGNPESRLLAKMHGVPQPVIDGTRPADFLPYVMGYMAALNGGTKESGDDIAPEYFRGFERGENVRAGKCPAPSWIQSQS